MVEKATTFLGDAFGPHFLLSTWLPTLIASLMGLGVYLMIVPDNLAAQIWQRGNLVEQGVSVFIALLVVTFISMLLSAFLHPLVQMHEGIDWPGALDKWGREANRAAHQTLCDSLAQARKANKQKDSGRLRLLLSEQYPVKESILPTRLGNSLAAAEKYAMKMYGIDGLLWWSRLSEVLPEKFVEGMSGASTMMHAMLNFSVLSLFFALAGGLAVAWLDDRLWLFFTVFVAGLVLWQVFYRAALESSYEYGYYIRTAFDLYRFDLLKALHAPLPQNAKDERDTWKRLTAWLLSGFTGPFVFDHDAKREANGDGK